MSGEEIERLEEIAEKIPSMGGFEWRWVLRELSAKAPAGTSIVEVGSWLGAGTAQLALGLRTREGSRAVQLHCFDRWQVKGSQVAKAARRGVELMLGSDTLPIIKETLEQFHVSITFHKGNILDASWNHGPISVYVDDAAKTAKNFRHALKTFGPHWIPGETVVLLMDFLLWKTTALTEHQCQKRFIEEYAGHFEELGDYMFRYKKALDFENVRVN